MVKYIIQEILSGGSGVKGIKKGTNYFNIINMHRSVNICCPITPPCPYINVQSGIFLILQFLMDIIRMSFHWKFNQRSFLDQQNDVSLFFRRDRYKKSHGFLLVKTWPHLWNRFLKGRTTNNVDDRFLCICDQFPLRGNFY